MSLQKAGKAALAAGPAGGPTARPAKRIAQFFAPCAILCATLWAVGNAGPCGAQESDAGASAEDGAALEAAFRNPPAAARPWAIWYWMDAAVSREGLTADLEAMKAVGYGGAYLMPIKGPTNPPRIDPPAVQLSPVFWEMVKHAATEADRVGIELAGHVCDGFATAGGPWITPELSMQRLVWSRSDVDGSAAGRNVDAELPQPPTKEDYYRDVVVLAFPSPEGAGASSRTVTPKVATSEEGFDGAFLAGDATRPNAPRWRCDGAGWIEYAFDEPFTARSMTVWPDGTNYGALRLCVEAQDASGEFQVVKQLVAPRHGWQEGQAAWTYSLPATTSRVFRFAFDPEGSEPGAEDLDLAKWKPNLKVRGIELLSEARINQFEGKSGAAWRISKATPAEDVPAELCVPRDKVVDVTKFMDAEGRLRWEAPAGKWIVLRMGHTSTGKRNETAGGGKGLECDKFSVAAVSLQYDKWFGEMRRQIGSELAARVLKGYHMDSWECGTQNWTAKFAEEFKTRRGYDLLPWLPAMAGVPVESAAESERVLLDVRRTIGELMVDNFFGTMAKLAHADGCWFNCENTAPTFVGDGMAHFDKADAVMGEFWLRSPTHDKPNDMLDAISAAHIYGKKLVQAEAFTELRLSWDESPETLKALGDRHFALGVNRLATHVWAHNPWLDRKPGMTLSGIGTFLQRDQAWFPMARGWTDYLARCQAMLQFGRPVVDVAVFTGEDLPRRAVTPWELVDALPGMIGEEAVERERKRLANVGQLQREMPRGVTASAGIPSLSDWPDPLRGYAYDSINRDALLRLAKVENGRLTLPGGASYGVLVMPGVTAKMPNGDAVSPEVAAKIRELAAGGVTVIDKPFDDESLAQFGMIHDFAAISGDARLDDIAWTHRTTDDVDIYFVANPSDEDREFDAVLRVVGRQPQIWNPMTGEISPPATWKRLRAETSVSLQLAPRESVFVVLQKSDALFLSGHRGRQEFLGQQEIKGPWQLTLGNDAEPRKIELGDWTASEEDTIKYFSGMATYETSFDWTGDAAEKKRTWLDLGRVANVAEVTLNGKACGIAWLPPYRVEITSALKAGKNELRIAVANTWHNRLVGDARLPDDERTTWTSAPTPPRNAKLLEAGLLGPVQLLRSSE
jgi:hypothetical protein